MGSIIWSFGRLLPSPSSHWIEGVLKMIVEASLALIQCVRENAASTVKMTGFRFEGSSEMEFLRCTYDQILHFRGCMVPEGLVGLKHRGVPQIWKRSLFLAYSLENSKFEIRNSAWHICFTAGKPRGNARILSFWPLWLAHGIWIYENNPISKFINIRICGKSHNAKAGFLYPPLLEQRADFSSYN